MNTIFFFRRDALKEQFGKEPSTVRCLAVKSALLGTRHPRKEKEAALQNVTGEPACLYGKIIMTTQSEMEPSIKIEELKSVAHNRRGRQSTGPRKACCRVPPPKGERPIYPTSMKIYIYFFLEEARPQVETEGMPLPQPPGSAASKVVTREKDRKRA